MQFRPTLWPSLITIPALAVLLMLGWWQVERLAWKTALIQELEIRSNAPAIPLPTDPRIPTGDLLFRKVVVTGSYVHEAEMHLLNQVRNGVPGINLFTPLVLDNNAGTILVNRGWVPLDWPGTPAGDGNGEADRVEVTGIVRVVDPPGGLAAWFTPENEPVRNAWYHIDLDAMAHAAGMLVDTDYYLFATDEKYLSGQPAPLLRPDPNEWRIDLPNNHLSYAITWFSLAGALFVIYVIYHTRRRVGHDD